MRDVEKNYDEVRTHIRQQVTRLAQSGGGGGGSGIGLFPKDTFRPRNIVPEANSIYSLGSDGLRFKDLFLSGNTIALGEATISASAGGGVQLPAGSTIGSESIAMTVKDEGTEVGNTVSVINFVGTGVAATGNTSHITVTVSGGGGGSSGVSNGFVTSTFISNTAARALINDRIQVANATSTFQTKAVERAALANTNSRIVNVNTNLTATNTAIRSLVSDRMQVANTTLLVNDRLQVANATTTFQTKAVERAALANTNTAIAAKATTDEALAFAIALG